MPDQEDVQSQQELLAAHRRTLRHYLQQQAALGTAYMPPGTAYGIQEEREKIQQLKAILREWDAFVEDLPEDKEASSESNRSHTARRSAVSQRLVKLADAGLFFIMLILALVLVRRNQSSPPNILQSKTLAADEIAPLVSSQMTSIAPLATITEIAVSGSPEALETPSPKMPITAIPANLSTSSPTETIKTSPTAPPTTLTPADLSTPEGTVIAFLNALRQGDDAGLRIAVGLFSKYSSGYENVQQIVEDLQHASSIKFGYTIEDIRLIEEQVVRVVVSFRGNDDIIIDCCVLRQVDGKWLINPWHSHLGPLIDMRLVEVDPQTRPDKNSLTIDPLRIIRFTRGMLLVSQLINNRDRCIRWGQGEHEQAAFDTRSERIFGYAASLNNGVKLYSDTTIIISAKERDQELLILFPGYIGIYPDSIEIRNFRWSSPDSCDFTDLVDKSKWSYSFNLKYTL